MTGKIIDSNAGGLSFHIANRVFDYLPILNLASAATFF